MPVGGIVPQSLGCQVGGIVLIIGVSGGIVPIIGVSVGRNSAPSLVSVEGIVPHHWVSVEE
ncbi:unnamed protein product [Staurois parvus]|uniref:Uncharacterized protein n=1 Tax=Staurois parvus TaxID=386267 RepID=A0ABN9EDR8_9NEOB|nr:unnamed protein product [Staurois parvus]